MPEVLAALRLARALLPISDTVHLPAGGPPSAAGSQARMKIQWNGDDHP
jgi:hypothetical protein